MVVIGIDPGTALTGYGIIEEQPDGNFRAIAYGVIQTSPNEVMPARLLQISQSLRQLLQLYKPDIAAVEKLFVQRNIRTVISVGQSRGVVLLCLAEVGLSVAEYTPLEVKQAVTGYGGANKKQMQNMIQLLLNLSEIPSPDDAADALSVALCHIQYYKHQIFINQNQFESL